MHRRDLPKHLLASLSAIGAALAVRPRRAQARAPVSQLRYPPADVRQYGADPTARSDSTAAFQSALDGNGRVEVPDGTYLLQPGKLALPQGVEIVLSPRAEVRVNASGTYIFNCLGRNRISGGRFTCPTGDDVAVAQVLGGISDVTVSRISCSGCRILYAHTTAHGHSDAREDNCPSDIRVSDCMASTHAAHSKAAAVFLGYVRDCAVWGNRIHGYTGGIAWWGGDAAKDGLSITDPRKCHHLQIFGNQVSRVGGGGIWGSMGRQISIQGNSVSAAGDVGIDFEGCIDCVAAGNTVDNAVNGCLATFFQNAGIVFNGNVCTVSDERHPLFCMYNSSQSPENNIDIALSANSFACVSGRIGVISQRGPYRLVSFSNNILRNVRIGWEANNLNVLDIRGNSFMFDADPGVPFSAIDCCGGFAYGGAPGQVGICGNRIVAYFAPALGSLGVHVVTRDEHGTSSVHIGGNSIHGFAVSVGTTEAGRNRAVAGTYLISGNVLGNGVYRRTESGARYSTVRLVDNFTAAGEHYPAGIPVAGRWDVGQLIWNAAPRANGAPGAVCVGAGTPGTWTRMASLGD